MGITVAVNLINPKAKATDFTQPGHVLGLIAHQDRLHKRLGHTEAAVALAKLAGFTPVGILCEIVRSDGRMARLPDLKRLAKKFKLKMVSIEKLRTYLKN